MLRLAHNKMIHKNHIIKSETINKITLTSDDSSNCNLCIKNRKNEIIARIQKEEQRIQQSEVLQCDKCRAFLGYVYICDIEGTWFYCKTCKNI